MRGLVLLIIIIIMTSRRLSRYKICLQCRRPRFDPWVGKDPLKKGMATHSSSLAWRIPMDRGAWGAMVHGVADELGRDWVSYT